MSPHSEKLHPLTTLRFLAAAMIVVYHSAGLFGFPQHFNIGILLDQAVSFFFVLSGFILTYVYPRLDSFKDCRRFWFARFARVWPAHFAAFLFFICLLGFSASTSTAGLVTALNLLLLQAWIPTQKIFFSFNPVSWSISTEVAFYLAFPLLIRNWQRTWALKLLLTFLLALAVVLFANYTSPPPLDGSSLSTAQTSFDGWTYINPLARLFEFTLGMSTCLLFRALTPRLRISPLLATVAEIAAFAIAFLMMHFTTTFTAILFRTSNLGPALAFWSARGPICAWAFALLILTLAFQRGWISRLLSTSPCILLGELSFSVYLLHYSLRVFYQRHSNRFDAYPGWLTYSYFWAILLLLSWLVWSGFERPVRLRILSLWKFPQKPSPPTTPPRPNSLLAPTPATLAVASLAFILLLAPVAWIRFTNPPAENQHLNIAAIQNDTPAQLRDARFGNFLELVGCQIHSTPAATTLDLTWHLLTSPPPNLQIAIHLLDSQNNIIAQADYVPNPARLSTPQIPWTDSTSFTPAQLQKAHALAIAVYQLGAAPFLVDRGPRDWDNHRLLLQLSPPNTTTQSN